jgi:ribosomal protein S18 acetylase RimI-like enzyme
MNMTTESKITVRSAEERDRPQIANLIHFEAFVHRHLDWRPPLDWIGYHPYLIGVDNNQIIAALACPPDPPGVTWVRVFACSGKISPSDAWDLLWPQAETYLIDAGTTSIAVIPLQKKFRQLLEQKSFQHIHNVIVFAWDDINPTPPNAKPINIRQMREDELEIIQEIDEQAFGPIWRYSLDSITLAFNKAILATIAEDQTGLLGYQISTPSPYGAHLARLAVRPSAQHQGIGYALTRHLQDSLKDTQPIRISVNTQDYNHASIALYQKAGFTQTDESYPVFLYDFGD